MLEPFLDCLRNGDARQRATAADNLADLLRSDALHQDEVERVIAGLVAVAASSQSAGTVEAALNAICDAFEHYRPPLKLVRPLTEASTIDEPVLLEAMLDILASTYDPAAGALISAYLGHPDPAVQLSAEHALAELPGRVRLESPRSGRYITPAFARQWARDVSADAALLAATFVQTHGYPCGENVVAGPASTAELSALTRGEL